MEGPPTEGPSAEGAPLTAMGPLLEPGVLPSDDEEGTDEQAPGTDEAEATDEAPPAPGGALGAAVAAALRAALERTGVVPPQGPPEIPATPPTSEPLDLLDTSSAPWLRDPELGVQWAESWIASHQDHEVAPGEVEAEVEEGPELAAPIADPSDTPPPPPVQEIAVTPPPPPPAPPPPPPEPLPSSREAAPPEPVPLPPRSRPYEPRSLELFSGQAGPASVPATWAQRTVPAPDPVRDIVAVASPRSRRPGSRIPVALAIGIGLVLGLIGGLVAYAAGPAVTDVYLTRYDVPVRNLPEALDGLRIVQVSDLHLPGSAATADSAARLVVRARPDIVLITGDMIDDASPATLEALDRFLAMTRGSRGTFAILGERETTLREQLEPVYAAKGIRLLANERASLEVGNARLIVAGFDGSSKRRLQLTPAGTWDMGELVRPRAEIIMTHASELLADVPAADLKTAAFVVAGHSLGGTLGLPSLLGQSSRYRSGWYMLEDTHLYVSNGIGTGRLRARLLAPAEVTRFTLRRATQPFEAPSAEAPGSD
ncbi:MAG: metallophosphoesterase [Gemmatimonadales bacterium]